MKNYSPKIIEPKWQKYWEKEKLFKADDKDNKRPKFYCLDMFPYPSGAGLHVGHVESYTATDIYSRFMRMNGYNVLHPQGWDAFGLPAENYAIKTKIHPKITTKKALTNFKRQIQSMGFSYDWSREINTSDPEYYKWTQWIFLELYKNGLAIQKKAPVNWCESCQTVLAREQVIDGKCERCGNIVIQKSLTQWFFKITDYAEKLLDGLKNLNWPESIKLMQENWIGRSSGSLIKFQISSNKIQTSSKSQIPNLKQDVKVFTTRPDTIFGATYLVLAPEHDLISNLKSQISNFKEVENYIDKTKKKTELERTSLEKVKTGVELKGICAINPATKKEIPIYIADYVLTTYGTGAIMAVPAHDERDHEFAIKYNLPIVQTIAKDYKKYLHTIKVLNVLNNIQKEADSKKFKFWVLGGLACAFNVGFIYRDHEDLDLIVKSSSDLDELKDVLKNIGCKFLEEKKYNTFSLLDYESKDGIKIEIGKHEDKETLFDSDFEENIKKLENVNSRTLSPRYLISFKHWRSKQDWIKDYQRIADKIDIDYLDGKIINEAGTIIGTNKFNGMDSEKAKDEIVEFVGGKKSVQYRLKDWLVSRQRYWGAPIPIIYCDECAKKKIKVLVIHGVTGNNNENWFPWLKKQVEDSGAEFICPNLPNSNTPTLTEWINHLEKYADDLNENSIIIGHSLGATAALHLIKKINKKIDKLILVAPTSKEMGIENFRKKYQNKDYFSKETVDSIENFIKEKIDWEKINNNINESIIYFSKNDPYIDIDSKKYFEKNVNAKFLVCENKGHFNENYGIKEFSELLNVLNLNRSSGIVPVLEKDLPVELPDDVDFKPTGESPLVRSKKFHDVKCPKCGSPARRESDTMDTFVCSSWYYLAYAMQGINNFQFPISKYKDAFKKWLPVDLYIGGKEHATGHLIFSRFITKALKDLKYLDFNEPFTRLNNQGIIIASDGRKMSKSLGNVINPDDVVSEYGADSLRMYEMFMGPLEDQKPWDTKGIVGIKRFLDRVWNLLAKLKSQNSNVKTITKNSNLLNQTIKKVTANIKDLKFNTAISAMMIFVNEISKDCKISMVDAEKFLLILSPFAPHIAEELWHVIGHDESIFSEKWPKATEVKIDRIKVAVQINGKVRGIIEASPGSSEKEILALAQNEANITKYLEGKNIKKSIYISGKILSLVI